VRIEQTLKDNAAAPTSMVMSHPFQIQIGSNFVTVFEVPNVYFSMK